MNEYLKNLLDYCKDIAIRYDEISKLLMAPEISIDVRLYRRLQSELNSKKEIVDLYKKINEELEFISFYEKDLSNASIKEKTQIQYELDKLNEDILTQQNLLIKLINKTFNEISRFYIELTIDSKSNSQFGLSILKDIYINFIKLNNGIAVIENKDEHFIKINCTCDGVFELLKSEVGLHKLIDQNKTTIIKMIIYPNRDNKYFVSLDDIKIETYHSSGAGGQNVNKVETAIRAIHIPTKITVTCQDERSQLKNKQRALEKLYAKIQEYYKEQDIKKMQNDKKEMSFNKNLNIRLYNVDKDEVIDNKIGDKTIFSLNDIKKGNLDKILVLNK